ncbi:MAG: type IV secretory system conjugative DNA transfer family protein [Candidatus Gracilibacteria bacterium]
MRLCETREYSPRIIEHYLHTIQKMKRETVFLFLSENKKIKIFTSEDLSDFFPGSTFTPEPLLNTLARAKTTPQTPFFARQTKGHLLPIKRYSQFEDRTQKTHISPLENLLPILARTEGAFVLITLTPVKDRTRRKALKKAKKPHFEPERAFDKWETYGWFSFLSLRALLGPLIRYNLQKPPENSSSKAPQEQTESLHEREDPRKAVLDKLSRPLFRTQIILSHNFENFLSGFTLPYLGQLKISKKPQKMILSAEEIASILSPPNARTAAPYLETEKCAFLPAPSSHPLSLTEEDRKRHLYIVGKTGMGKSTAILNIFHEDALLNRTIIILDPHSDLIEDALKITPAHRQKDIILLDPTNTENPLALNPLERAEDESASLKTSALIEIFEVLSHGSWGPRLEYILRNALLLLTLNRNTTLLDLPHLLTNPTVCKRFLSQVHDTELTRFFTEEFLNLDSKTRQEYISPILNKVGPLLSSPLTRNIIGQPKSKFNFAAAFQKKSIILIPLPKSRLGDDFSRMLGMVFISLIQNAIQTRAANLQNRNFVSLIIDEFQNFATRTLQTMLAESRKYGLALTIANQYLTQLPEELSAAVLGNAGSILSFQVSYEDAQILAPTLGVTEEDLCGLPPFQAYAKFLNQNRAMPIFRLETQKIAQKNQPDLASIRAHCQKQVSRPLSLVEEKIKNRYNISRKNNPRQLK